MLCTNNCGRQAATADSRCSDPLCQTPRDAAPPDSGDGIERLEALASHVTNEATRHTMGQTTECMKLQRGETRTTTEDEDDLAVNMFAAAMKIKLRKKRREGRDDPGRRTVDDLAEDLVDRVAMGDPVDVANLAIMVWHRSVFDEDGAAAHGAILSVRRAAVRRGITNH